MRISTYNNIFSSKLSFGYDKKLNEQVKSALGDYKEDAAWAKSMLQMNEFCNFLEDTIIAKQRKGKDDDAAFNDLVDIFVTSKQTFAEQIDYTLEELKYTEKESRHYEEKALKLSCSPDDWRMEVMEALAVICDNPPLTYVVKELQKKQAQESVKPQNITESTPKTSSTSKNSYKFVKEYIPNEKTPKGFCDVVGMSEVKEKLNEGFITALTKPEEAELDKLEYGINFPRGILLYGPPGCGKTFITQALAQETGLPLYTMTLGDLGSKYVNETSNNISAAFDEIIQIANKSQKPCLLFLDEIDSLAFKREDNTSDENIKQVDTLLQAMDRAEHNKVFIVAATNKYNLLDTAIKRRFTDKCLVSVPDFETRKFLIKNFFSKIQKGQDFLQNEENIDKIASQLDGYSNDSICKIAEASGKIAKKRNRDNITYEDFVKAIQTTTEEKPNLKEYLADKDKKKTTIGFLA